MRKERIKKTGDELKRTLSNKFIITLSVIVIVFLVLCILLFLVMKEMQSEKETLNSISSVQSSYKESENDEDIHNKNQDDFQSEKVKKEEIEVIREDKVEQQDGKQNSNQSGNQKVLDVSGEHAVISQDVLYSIDNIFKYGESYFMQYPLDASEPTIVTTDFKKLFMPYGEYLIVSKDDDKLYLLSKDGKQMRYLVDGYMPQVIDHIMYYRTGKESIFQFIDLREYLDGLNSREVEYCV